MNSTVRSIRWRKARRSFERPEGNVRRFGKRPKDDPLWYYRQLANAFQESMIRTSRTVFPRRLDSAATDGDSDGVHSRFRLQPTHRLMNEDLHGAV